ncbi:bacterial Ig-like domain-containing protein, partial [Enterococcus caccae]|uniref:bacterial Ig-like domain-containing protein n=2 Tax=Enterococcus caccae TaxID=317735 RepID=UPI0003394659
QTSIKTTNSTITVGETWNPEDNFVSATDKEGKEVAYTEINVEGNVDTNKAGEYIVTYSYGSVTQEAVITVKEADIEDQTSIKTTNSTITVGETWNPEDNFVSATDKEGKEVTFTEIKVEGRVDTSKAGEYTVTYSYGSVTQKALITVKAADIENQTSVKTSNSTITVGEKWTPEDNFVSATDEVGKEIAFIEIKVEGSVDTSKAGEYTVTYSYGSVTQEAIITVKEADIEDQTSIKTTNSTITVGEKWTPEDNFVSATDEVGKEIAFIEIKVEGSVDTSKAGEYTVTYSYGSVTQEAIITVKEADIEDQTSIKTTNSTIPVGEKWTPEDNFVSATDKEGKEVAFTEIKVEGNVDTNKAGEYIVTYSYSSVTQEAVITVRNKEVINDLGQTTGDNQPNTSLNNNEVQSNNFISDEKTSSPIQDKKIDEKMNEEKYLPKTGEQQNILVVILGLVLLVSNFMFRLYVSKSKE